MSDSIIAEAHDHSKLDGMTFYGKPVQELDRDELLSLVVVLHDEVGHLEERQMSSEQYAQKRLYGRD